VSIATVGGAINAGAGGLRGAKYGTMRDWVLGLTIVLPDERGSIVRVGCRTTKCRQGYDLVRLIVGSEGTLAVVTDATLKITPLPEATVVSLAFFPTLEGFYEAYRVIKSGGVTCSW
jgi:glycolate oxidase